MDLSPVKLRDDLTISAEKFKVENYLQKSEAFKYIGELPGVEDIINAIDGFIGEIAEFLGMLKDLLLKLLEWLDIFGLISSLDDLLGFLFGIFNNGLFGFGFPLTNRGAILDALKGGCINLNNTYNFNGLEQYALLSMLIGLGCSGMDSAYSTTYNLFMNTPTLTDQRTQLSVLQQEYNITDSQEEKDRLSVDITNLSSLISGQENSVNALFKTATPQIYTALSKQNNVPLQSVVGLTNDIGRTPVAGMLGSSTNGTSSLVLNALNSTDGNTSKISNSDYDSFITTLSSMDSGFNNNVVKSNPTLSAMTQSSYKSKSITGYTKPTFSLSDYYLL